MALAPDELCNGYGTKGHGRLQKVQVPLVPRCAAGKLQDAVGHFLAKHLGHEPFLCSRIHVDSELLSVPFCDRLALHLTFCLSGFPRWKPWGNTRSERRNSRLRESSRAVIGAFRTSSLLSSVDGQPPFSGRSYTSVSSLNRHHEKCGSI